MPFDRFLIAPMNTGLQTDLRPWLIPDDAFAQLNNAYVFRGRVRKRFGSDYTGTGWPTDLVRPLYSRVRYRLGVITGGGTLAGNVPGISKEGQQFSINTQIFTAYQANGALFATPGPASGTFNTVTGAYSFINGTPGDPVYFYLSEPIMGLANYESGAIDDRPSVAFDTRFAYIYNGTWEYSTGSGPWHGDDTNFFWTTNWQGAIPADDLLYVSNFYVNDPNGPATANDDPIWYFDGTTWTAASGANAFYFQPAGGAPQTGPFVATARIIVPFKNRLLLLNVIENDNVIVPVTAPFGTNTQYTARVRWSAYGNPLTVNAWYDINQSDNAGNNNYGASYLDASTDEEIISAEFIKDRLIVYFEQSTWELAYTGNQVNPFVWQKINTELGADSTFSVVPFDKEVVAIGNVGVHSCNGANVSRIDNKIPDQIFDINENADGVVRIVGIRDYYVEMVYWTFPNNSSTRFPNKILCYNYRNGSWSFNDDSITFFGYFEQQVATTWANIETTWEASEETWSSGVINTNFRQVIAGNQQGFIFIISPDNASNAALLSITNMVQSANLQITITVKDHNLPEGSYISIENLSGVTLNAIIYEVFSVVDANTITVKGTLTGTYAGGAVISRVSNIDIYSKQWNPYVQEGRSFYLARIDFCVAKTTNGEITVDYFPSDSDQSMLYYGNGGASGTNMLMGNGVLETRPYDPAIYPFEQTQNRLWHPIYFQTEGECVQIHIYMSPEQIITPNIAWSDFELQGLVLHTKPTSQRLQ